MGEEQSTEITNWQILKAIENSNQELRSKIDNLKISFDKQCLKTENRLENTEEHLKEHAKQLFLYEKERRSKNVILNGIEETEKNRKELENLVLKFLNENLKTNTTISEIDNIFRLGNNQAGRNRPIIIKFLAQRKAAEVLSNRKHLKYTQFYICEDLPKKVIEERKKLMPTLKKCKQEGKRAIFKYNKLFVDGQEINLAKSHLKRNRSDNEEINTECPQKVSNIASKDKTRMRSNSLSVSSEERGKLPEAWRTLFPTNSKFQI